MDDTDYSSDYPLTLRRLGAIVLGATLLDLIIVGVIVGAILLAGVV